MAKRDYAGVVANIRSPDLFSSSLLCFVLGFGYDGTEDTERLEVLHDILYLGKKKGFDVNQAIASTIEYLSTQSELHKNDAKFIQNIKDAFAYDGYKPTDLKQEESCLPVEPVPAAEAVPSPKRRSKLAGLLKKQARQFTPMDVLAPSIPVTENTLPIADASLEKMDTSGLPLTPTTGLENTKDTNQLQ